MTHSTKNVTRLSDPLQQGIFLFSHIIYGQNLAKFDVAPTGKLEYPHCYSYLARFNVKYVPIGDS